MEEKKDQSHLPPFQVSASVTKAKRVSKRPSCKWDLCIYPPVLPNRITQECLKSAWRKPRCRNKHVHPRPCLSNAPGGESYGKWPFGPTIMSSSAPDSVSRTTPKPGTCYPFQINEQIVESGPLSNFRSFFVFSVFSFWWNMSSPVLIPSSNLFVTEQIPLQTLGEAIETRHLWGTKHFIPGLFDLICFAFLNIGWLSRPPLLSFQPLLPTQSEED